MANEVTIISKNNQEGYIISKIKARKLVAEGSAIELKGIHNMFKMLFTEEELFQHVIERDHYNCRICGKIAETIGLIIPKFDDGLKTPTNLVSLCFSCHNEKKYEFNLSFLEKNKKQKQTISSSKTCIICKKDKEKIQFNTNTNNTCNSCSGKQLFKGIVFVIDENNDTICYISVEKTKEILENNLGSLINKKGRRKLKVRDPELLEKLEVDFNNGNEHIVISYSGNWSIESTKEEADEIVSEGLGHRISPNIVKRNSSMREFRESVMKRDNYTCKICSKKCKKEILGVSLSKIATFSNSITTCIFCEKQFMPDKFLKWLNIKEASPSTITSALSKTVKMIEKYKNNEYVIYLKDADRLIKEGMAVQIAANKIRIKYNEREFKQFILNSNKHTCHYCEEKGDTLDHLIPKSKGGLTSPMNCVCSCGVCNEEKGNLHLKKYISLKN